MRPPNKSRSRNKNNRRGNNLGNALNRVYESAGPDGKVRGTPAQVIEKYQALAHDSALAGDRVATENFQQHAEHYIRLISDVQRQLNERREAQEQEQNNRQSANNGGGGEPQSNDSGAERQQDAGNQPQPQPQAAPGESGLAMLDDPAPAESGLVETPETAVESTPSASEDAPKPRRGRPRKPKTELVEDAGPTE